MPDLLRNKLALAALVVILALAGLIAAAATDMDRLHALSRVIQTIITAVSDGSFYALAALGIGLLFGVLRLINFAYGDWTTVAGYALLLPSSATVATMVIGAFHPAALILTIIGFMVALALLSEALVFRPLRNATPATMMIASFALGFVLYNVIIMIYGGRPKSAAIFPELNQTIEIAEGVSVQLLKIVTIGITIGLLALLTLFLTRTPVGIQMRASAEDFRMARMLGVRANLVIATAFVISGVLAAFVSLIFVTQLGILRFNMGLPIIVFAFIATVIGGMGSLIGSVIGGFLVGSSKSVLLTILPDDIRGYADAFVFAIVLAILLVRPQGLVPARSARERV